MKALVVCHKTKTDLGIFEKFLKDHNFNIDIRLGYHDDLGNLDASEHDLAIFMGGPMGVYQDDIFPYLKNEISYIQKRLGADKPYLGICLGAQLMAKALGAKVYPGKQGKEIGWHEIKINDQGKSSAVKHLDLGQTKMMQWHGDTFDLPDNAQLLASSKLYENQIIAYGDKALGLQGHPEVTSDNIELWLATGYHELQTVGLNVPALREQTKKHVAQLNKQTEQFFNEWLNQVLA